MRLSGIDFLLRRRNAYRAVFGGPQGKLVLADLRRFCRATATTFARGEPETQQHLEGRREVFLRIQAYLNLDDQALWALTEERDDDG